MGVFKVSNADKAARVLDQTGNKRAPRQVGRRPIHTR
jgi:hypothetical protein